MAIPAEPLWRLLARLLSNDLQSRETVLLPLAPNSKAARASEMRASGGCSRLARMLCAREKVAARPRQPATQGCQSPPRWLTWSAYNALVPAKLTKQPSASPAA